MTMDRHTHRLVTEIMTVLERHGHHARDREHADQAVNVITQLAGIYDGTRDLPASTGRHAAPQPHPEPRPEPDSDALVLTGADISTVLAALDLAAEYKRDLAETCADCADQSCASCQYRLQDAHGYDRLADRIYARPRARRPCPARTGPTGRLTRPNRPRRRQGSRPVTIHAPDTPPGQPGPSRRPAGGGEGPGRTERPLRPARPRGPVATEPPRVRDRRRPAPRLGTRPPLPIPGRAPGNQTQPHPRTRTRPGSRTMTASPSRPRRPDHRHGPLPTPHRRRAPAPADQPGTAQPSPAEPEAAAERLAYSVEEPPA